MVRDPLEELRDEALQLPAGSGTWYGKLPGLAKMVDHTIEMVDTVTDAFVRQDAEAVRDIAEVDDTVDELFEDTFNAIIRFMKEDILDEEIGARYLLVGRYLERIADDAVNIGERVVYMVTGERLPRIRFADRQSREAGSGKRP